MSNLRASLVTAAGAIAVGLAVMGLGAPPFEVSFLTACGALPEGTAFRLSGMWWPPGATRCTAVLPDGQTLVRTYLPWGDWLTVGLAAAAAVAFVYAARHEGRAFVVAIALGLCSFVSWARGPAAGVIATALVATFALVAHEAGSLRKGSAGRRGR